MKVAENGRSATADVIQGPAETLKCLSKKP